MYYAGLDVACKGSYPYIRNRRGKKVEGKEIVTSKTAEFFSEFDLKPVA